LLYTILYREDAHGRRANTLRGLLAITMSLMPSIAVT
jgi:hypothetical protein